jgi:acetate---CoA ligase (ADP-forming)
VPVVAAEEAASLDAALAAAGRVGWPVALKTAAPGVHHKTAVGGVHLGLAGPERLAAAYADLAGRLGPRVVVARTAAGVELAVGLVRDPQFGPLVMVAAGGVLVEVLRDRRFLLPPVDARTARAALDRLAVRPLLDGAGPGARPADLDAVAGAVVALSGLAVDALVVRARLSRGRAAAQPWTRSPVCLRNCCTPAARHTAAATASTASDQATLAAQPRITRVRMASIA